jgi:hypothetical protein
MPPQPAMRRQKRRSIAKRRVGSFDIRERGREGDHFRPFMAGNQRNGMNSGPAAGALS